MTSIHDSVLDNDLAAVKKAIAATHHGLEELDRGGYTPLMRAVARRDIDVAIVEALLQAGANVHFAHTWEGGHYTETVLQLGMKSGRVEVVQTLQRYGADLLAIDENGHSSILHAIHAEGDRLPLVQFLIQQGVNLDSVTKYRETAISSAYRLNQFSVVRALIAAGADESPLKWSPLMRAIALGSTAEIERMLEGSPDLEHEDRWERTAVELALALGDLATATLLWARGARLRDEAILSATDGGNVDAVRWLVEQGADLEVKDFMGNTPLARAAEADDRPMAEALLGLGANPNAKLSYDSILESAKSKEMIELLIRGGAEAGSVNNETRRLRLGLGEVTDAPLHRVSREEFLRGCYPREGRANPEDLTDPFKVAMIQAGLNAWAARKVFDLEADFSSQREPVWCAERFGQTMTVLPDGRSVLIAGEHEDSYDPNFCIYNDVIVFSGGEISIYGYPYSVFPPTDFHTATLVGEDIYILGSLGYAGSRKTPMPVYRLSTRDFSISAVKASGDDPGRLYEHKTRQIDDGVLQVTGGKRIKFRLGSELHIDNKQTFRLDIRSGIWVAEKT